MSEAIILAGGLGTRLRGVVDVPKPIAPIRGRPFLGWLLDRLAACGFRHVVLATGHGADAVHAAIGEAWLGIRISYSVETEPLGTGGAVAQALALVADAGCHVMNGDTYMHYDAAALEALVRRQDAEAGMVLAEVADVARYGAIRMEDVRVAAFGEKTGSGPGLVNAGSYFLAPPAMRALQALPRPFPLEAGFLAPLAAAGGMVALAGAEHFIDIGIPEDYARAPMVLP